MLKSCIKTIRYFCLQGIMNELRGVFGNIGNGQAPNPSGNQRTISAYLESLPDYSYTEGESLVTDLLMLIARNTTFSDLVNILLGTNNSLDGLQRPLRYTPPITYIYYLKRKK